MDIKILTTVLMILGIGTVTAQENVIPDTLNEALSQEEVIQDTIPTYYGF